MARQRENKYYRLLNLTSRSKLTDGSKAHQ
jgi:hypothetical protein